MCWRLVTLFLSTSSEAARMALLFGSVFVCFLCVLIPPLVCSLCMIVLVGWVVELGWLNVLLWASGGMCLLLLLCGHRLCTVWPWVC